MPNPSQVSAQNINTELGVSSTAQLQLSNNWVKNLASTFSTSNSNVRMGDCRWGINFPGGDMVNYRGGAESYSKTYNLNNTLTISSFDIVSVYDSFTTVQAAAWITLFSNGVMRIEANDTGDPGYSQHFTWLTSGANSEYTAQFNLTSGQLNAGSSTANTDHALTADRSWYIVTTLLQGSGGDNANTRSASGNLIIKSGGTTLITRPVSLYAEAILGSL